MSAEFQPPQNPSLTERLHQFAEDVCTTLGRAAAVGLLVTGGSTVVLAGEAIVSPAIAHATDDPIQDALNAYPNIGMTCEHPNSQGVYSATGPCTNYDWGPVHTTVLSDPSTNSSRGYGYRNCTDWVAWRIKNLSGGTVSVPTGLGDAKDWPSEFPVNEVSTTPQPGDIAVSLSGTYGHVAVVESVTTDGKTMTVSEYNEDEQGDGDKRDLATSGTEFTEFINLCVHPSGTGSSTNLPDSTQVIINHAGEVWARTGVGSAGWTQETGSGAAADVASGGGVQVILDNAGQVWARSGVGSAWTAETGQYSAVEVGVGSDGTQVIRSYDNAVWAKNGVGSGGWVQETSANSAAEVETGGGVQVIRDFAGQLWVKNTIGFGGWQAETGQYSALEVAVSNNGTQMLRSYDGAVYARANTANSTWVQEAASGSAAQIAIGNGVQMIRDGAGQVWQKGASISWGGWQAETNTGAAVEIAITDDGTQLIRDNADQLWARSTDAYSTWVPETGQGTVAAIGE